MTLAVAALLLASCGGTATHTVSTPKTIPVPPATKYGGPTNFIPNPSFEKDVSYWKPYVSSRLARNTRVKRFGTASGQVTSTSMLPFGVEALNVLGYPLKGDRFTLSVWVKAFTATVHKRIVLELAETGKTTLETALTTSKLTGKWQRLHATGTVKQAQVTGLSVVIYISNTLMIGDGFYVDAATLYWR